MYVLVVLQILREHRFHHFWGRFDILCRNQHAPRGVTAASKRIMETSILLVLTVVTSVSEPNSAGFKVGLLGVLTTCR